MQWKLTHKHNHECIENKGGKTLSYDPNLGIQIIEQDGFAFKDLDNNGMLDPWGLASCLLTGFRFHQPVCFMAGGGLPVLPQREKLSYPENSATGWSIAIIAQ